MSIRPVLFACLLLAAVGRVRAEERVSFANDIAPILQSRCVACHGEKLAESDYRLDTFRLLMTGGIRAGDAKKSEFFQRLVTDDEDSRMPAESDPLTKSQIERVRIWIEQGAQFDGESTDDLLNQLVPTIQHPQPPQVYPSAIPVSAIASDGKQVFVSGYHEITAWSLDGELLRRITNQGERTYSIDLHPSRPWLLSASGSPGELGEVRLFDIETGSLVTVVQRSSETIMDARFSPDGTKIAVAMPDGSTRIINVESLEQTANLLGHSDAVVALAWHNDGVRLATASRDASAKVFDIEVGRSIATFTGHTECVNDVKFVSDQHLISVSSDGTAQRWRIDGGRREQVLLDHKRIPLLSVSVSAHSFLLCGATRTHLYELGDNRLLRRGDPPSDWMTASGILSGEAEDTFLMGTQAGRVLVWFGDNEKKPIEFSVIPD